LDSRGLAVFRTFDTPTTALDYIVARFGETLEASRADGPATATVPEYLAREGWNLQLQSYPYGTADAYLAAAEYFREAAALYSSPGTHWGSAEANHWQQAMAHWHDALGDHFYYKVEDFLQAATHYTRALGYAESDTSRNQATQAFAAYLRAIMLESIAFGLVKSGEIRLAKVVVEEAARRYEAAVAVSPSSDHPYLKHSSTGLQGEARYFHALACFQDGHLAEARAAVADAKALYQHALQWSPRWGEGCSSDNYARVMARVAQLEAQLGEAEEAGS
jgi:tetratricopeptide (TPR) repeat protein